MLFQASGCNALRAFYVADEADFAFREWFSDWNLNNFSSGNVFGSEFLRKEADSEIMGYHRENLIGGCHFHIRGEWEVVAHEILGVQFSGAAARGDSDEGKVLEILEAVGGRGDFCIFRSGDQDFAEGVQRDSLKGLF